MMGLIQSAYVIGRRDFIATVYSKTFLLFLLGPLLPIAFGFFFGSLGDKIGRVDNHPAVAVVAGTAEFNEIKAAQAALSESFVEKTLPDLIHAEPDYVLDAQVQDLLKAKDKKVLAVLTGGLAAPKLTGSVSQAGSIEKNMSLILNEVRQSRALRQAGAKVAPVPIAVTTVDESASSLASARSLTATMGQAVIFVLTMLLATMLLSNLVEEKSNKIIEILAASIPMESVFLGKLFAMLAMALLGIAVWTSIGLIGFAAVGPNLPNYPTPAVGWPMFIGLCFTYFIMAYLMLGALFLGIGAMAATVREVQTISMPVTMAQLINFFFASYALTKTGEPMEKFAAIFPFSSPFAMIGRAALEPTLWHHGVAIVGQVLFAVLLLRLGVYLFKKNVMKSGSAGRVSEEGTRKLFGFIKVRG